MRITIIVFPPNNLVHACSEKTWLLSVPTSLLKLACKCGHIQSSGRAYCDRVNPDYFYNRLTAVILMTLNDQLLNIVGEEGLYLI